MAEPYRALPRMCRPVDLFLSESGVHPTAARQLAENIDVLLCRSPETAAEI